MNEGWAKYLGGRVLGAVLAVAGLLVVIGYWHLAPEDRGALGAMIRGAVVWLGLAAVLPWAMFFVPARVMRAESNAASAAMLAAYLIADIAVALYLAGGLPATGWQKAVMVFGFLCAAVYNLLVCEFLARAAEDSG